MIADNGIKLDVASVLRERAPRLSRLIPGGVVRWLERTICQDDMNRLLEENRGLTGADFCRGVLSSLEIGIDVRNADALPPKEDRRVVFVSNHPLGGLDGMALIDVVQAHYGGQVWFIVNDLLMAIKPLNDVFLPINKHGAQSRRAAAAIEEAFAGNDPVLIFPAGLC
nr:glycerol acyltransferase [Muribaculaceae bacterium]